MKASVTKFGFAAALSAFVVFPLHAQDINTIVGGPTGGPGGTTPTLWVGQTFTVPAAQSFLNTIRFQIGADALFSANVVLKLWDAGTPAPTGPELVDTTITGLGSPSDVNSGFTANVFQALTPLAVYVAYIKVDTGNVGHLGWSDTYAGGHRVVALSGGATWLDQPTLDMGFQADFSGVVPEPATLILLATGLVGVGGMGLARRRKAPRC